MAKYLCGISNNNNVWFYFVKNNDNSQILFNSTMYYTNELNDIQSKVESEVNFKLQNTYGLTGAEVEFVMEVIS